MPSYANVFVRYYMLLVLSDAFYEIMNLAAKATGRLKTYRIATSAVSLVNAPLAYLLLSYGMKPEYTVLQISIINILVFVVQLYFMNKLIKLNYLDFVRKVLLPCTVVGGVVFVASQYIGHMFMVVSLIELIESCMLSLLISLLVILLLGLTSSERKFIFNFIKNKL